MSDIKFACPTCQQHIQCEPAYAGMEIACPSCQSRMIVPGTPVAAAAMAAAPAPVGAGAPGLRISTAAPPMPAPPQPQVGADGGPICPNCGSSVSPRAIMCVKCGTNLKTGQKMNVPGARPGARPAVAAAPAGPTVWYKTPYPYLGGYFAVLMLFYFLGNSMPIMKAFCALGVGLFLIGAHITVTVFAFKDDGIAKGFLCLCIGLYTIYYVFKESERQFAKVIYGIACVLGLLLKFDIINFDLKE